MHRAAAVGTVVFTCALASTAAADEMQLGAWVGPRVFASDTLLGFIPDAPAHPDLGSSVTFGARIGHVVVFPWLVPEFELAMSPTSTTAEGGAAAASVFWLEPRAHLRFELNAGKRLQPFVLIGGGAPIALSSARRTFDSGIVGAGHLGAGVRYDTLRGFVLRFDARVAFVPGARISSSMEEDPYFGAEIDVAFGIELSLGTRAKAVEQRRLASLDRDRDGVADDKDACADRAEDADGFDDLDGCPDIDNDLDRVLDIADKCTTVPEGYNGFEDDDGCPDTVPDDVEALRGTIEGLLYADAETAVRDSALPNIEKIAKTMAAHPSIRVVLIGHTDDREAKQFAEPVDGQPAPDVTELALDLSRARAEAVKQALTAAGVAASRIEIDGRGAEEPVAENDRPKGRLANRRVEIKLFVPPR